MSTATSSLDILIMRYRELQEGYDSAQYHLVYENLDTAREVVLKQIAATYRAFLFHGVRKKLPADIFVAATLEGYL